MHKRTRCFTGLGVAFGIVLGTVCAGFAGPATAVDMVLRVAISPDIPPYVIDRARDGLEVELLRSALPGAGFRFVQMPYDALQRAVPDDLAEVSIGVQEAADAAFYSRDVIGFVNVAGTRHADALRIDRVADLAGHTVLTWQGAYRELGGEFERLFAPGAPYHRNDIEIADQREQVRRFWAEPGQVIVIDAAILAAFSRAQGHSPAQLDVHELFPPVTDFKVAFRDAALRDAFDVGIQRLCASGAYAALLARHGVSPRATVCVP